MIEFTAVESDLDLEKFIWTLSGFYSSLQHRSEWFISTWMKLYQAASTSSSVEISTASTGRSRFRNLTCEKVQDSRFKIQLISNTERQTWDIIRSTQSNTPNITFVAEPTNKQNCSGLHWSVSRCADEFNFMIKHFGLLTNCGRIKK